MADPDYFTLAEFRLLPDMDDDTTYPDAKALAAAAYFTEIVEREVGVPFIPRTYTETLSGNGSYGFVLNQSHIRSLTSVTVGGVAVNVSSLYFVGGVVRYNASVYSGPVWTPGVGNVVVTYSAGAYDTCPADIKDPVMWATRDRLIAQSSESGSWDRKSSETSDFGTVNYVLAGEKRPTGYPDLDAAIAGRLRTTPSFGFA